MKTRALALLLSLLLLLSLVPGQVFAAAPSAASDAAPDSDYDGILNEYDPEPENNSFSGSYKSGNYKINLSYTLDYRDFFGDNTVYNPNIAGLSTWCAQLSYANEDNATVYTPAVPLRDSDGSSITQIYRVDQLMRAHGMENVIRYNFAQGYSDGEISMAAYADDDMDEAFYGHRRVEYNGQTIELIAVFVQGTDSTIEEWSSNFNVGNLNRFGQEYDAAEGKLRFPNADWDRKCNHRGFDVCANRIRSGLKAYLERYVDPEATPVFWLTGHSRGGAISNIMAAYLADQGEKVFAYTFASPNNTANAEAAAEKYDCIFNLVNGDDFVPRLPMPEWGFTRYGRTAIRYASSATSAQRSSYLGTTSYSYKSDSDLQTLCNKFVAMTVNNAGGNDGWRDVNVYHCGHQHADETAGEYRSGCIRKRSGLELGFNESMFNGWSARVRRFAYWSSEENGICETPAYAMQVLAELMGNLSLSGGWDYLTTNKLADRYDFGKTSLISYASGITDPHYMENYYLIQKLIEAAGSPDAAYTTETSLYTDGQNRPLHTHSYTLHPYEDQAPSCTEPGLGYLECKCSEINPAWYDDLIRDVEIPALGHDAAYTDNENGTHTETCSRCDYSLTQACSYEDGFCVYCGHPEPQHKLVRVYVVDELDGESLYAWAWGSAGNLDAAWPGHALTAAGSDKGNHPYYQIQLDLADYDQIIFNRGGQPQTGTLNVTTDAGEKDYVVYYVYGVSGNDLQVSQGSDLWPAPGAVTAPTCTEPGYTSYTGLFTGETRTGNEVPALGHTPGEPVKENEVAPTELQEGGYDMVTYCTVCGAELSREHHVVEAAGFTIYPSITIGIELKSTFGVRKSVTDQMASWYIEVSKLDAEGNPTETKRFNPEDVEEGFMMNAVYTDITAKEMGVSFKASFHGTDANGKEYVCETESTTLRDYILGELLKADNDDATRKLAADLLNYGAAAQVYFNFDAENLVNANLSAEAQAAMEQFADVGEAPATLENGSNGPNVYGSVSVMNRVVLSLTVRGVGSPSQVQVLVKNHETGEVKATIDAVQRGSVWMADYAGFEAEDMRTAFDFVPVADGTETGTPLTWSVEGYAKQARQNEDASKAELALFNALLHYVDAAAAAYGN